MKLKQIFTFSIYVDIFKLLTNVLFVVYDNVNQKNINFLSKFKTDNTKFIK